MKRKRNELEEILSQELNNIKSKNTVRQSLRNSLLQNKIPPGVTQEIIDGSIELSKADLSLLVLVTTNLHKITENVMLNPEDYFEQKEIKLSQNYQGYNPEEKIEYPLIFENVLFLTNEDYITTIDVKDIVNLFQQNILEYNFETQRDARFKKDRKTNKIIKVPKLNKKSLREIANHLVNGTFMVDTLTLNVLADGEENIIYDGKNKKLIINSGEINILDGFHRIKGALMAYERNPMIDFSFQVAIKNYSVRKAQAYVGQVNTVNRIDKSHLQALKQEKLSDYVVKELQRDSDLKGKVSQTSRVGADGIVSFSVLSDAIDDQFKIENKKEAGDLVVYLSKFFDYLIGSYPEINKAEKSLINYNNMFYGYVVLAKLFKDNNIPVNQVKQVLDDIDFSKGNKLWEEIGVLDSKGNITTKARKEIKNYFEGIDLNKLKGGVA